MEEEKVGCTPVKQICLGIIHCRHNQKLESDSHNKGLSNTYYPQITYE